MKKCGRCGSENKDEYNFCENCGARLEASKSNVSKRNLVYRFRNANIFAKLIAIVLIGFISLAVVGLIPHIFFGVPLEPYTDAEDTEYLEEFNVLDIDGDGALSFNEVEGIGSGIDFDKIQGAFDYSDKNDDGLLKGAEFDGYLDKIQRQYKLLEDSASDGEKTDSDSSSNSGNSIPAVIYEGKCPSCGSDERYMYEYYDEFGYQYYQCTVCDYKTYDENELYDY